MEIIRSKRGQIEIKVGAKSLFLFWPSFVKTNVDIGLMIKTGFMFKTFNKWSDDKSLSLAILMFGFGIGFKHSYNAT